MSQRVTSLNLSKTELLNF